MDEEVNMTEYDGNRDDDRVSDWELGLPTADDLTPLSHLLISPAMASAFSISPEPRRSKADVSRASRDTLSSIRGKVSLSTSSGVGLKSFDEERADKDKDGMVEEGEESDPDPDTAGDGSSSRKARRIGGVCDEESDLLPVEDGNDDGPARTQGKRARLVWTSQLHKRFVEVVGHLGIQNAVPKTIMQMMNVEGLTRENVASHLQKYRLYLKRMQGSSDDKGPLSSDPIFSSSPVPQSLHEDRGSGHGPEDRGSGHGHRPMPVPVQMPYPPQMMHMPMMMGMAHGSYQGYESYPYNMVQVQQQRDWSSGNFGSVASYQHVTGNDK